MEISASGSYLVVCDASSIVLVLHDPTGPVTSDVNIVLAMPATPVGTGATQGPPVVLMSSHAWLQGEPPVVSRRLGSCTYLTYRWMGSTIGWIVAQFETDIDGYYTALPANVPGTSTPTYVTGLAMRSPTKDYDTRKHLGAFAQIPAAVRQQIGRDVTLNFATRFFENVAGNEFAYSSAPSVVAYYGTGGALGHFIVISKYGASAAATDADHTIIHESGHALDYQWIAKNYNGQFPGGTYNDGGTLCTRISAISTFTTLYNECVADTASGINHTLYGFTGGILEFFAEVMSWRWQAQTVNLLAYFGTSARITRFENFLTSLGVALT